MSKLCPALFCLAIAILTGCSSVVSSVNSILNPDLDTSCSTYDADPVQGTSATLNGYAVIKNAIAKQAQAWFMIGTDESSLYTSGKKVPASNLNITDGKYSGEIKAVATGLNVKTKYYFQAYVLVDGVMEKGLVLSFTTAEKDGVGGGVTPGGDTPGGGTPGGDTPGGDTPGGGGEQDKPSVEISTGASGSIKENYATLSGKITLKGGASVESFGVMYSTDETPISANSTKIQADEKDASGNFIVIATGLAPDTKYYYRAYYVQDGSTTVADDIKNFTTAAPSVETLDASGIDMTTAIVSGKLTSIATDLDAEAWFLYGLSDLNTVEALKADGTKASASFVSGNTFSTGLSGLKKGYKYNFVAVTKISGKEFYGSVKNFKTIGPELSVSVSDPGSVWADYAAGITSSYEVVRPGDGEVTSGLIYCTHSFDPAQDVPSDAVVMAEGPKAYNIKRIVPGIKYYYAAFAGYGDLVFYSEVKSFSTPALSVSLTEFNVSNISAVSADVTVKVTANHVPAIFFTNGESMWFGPIIIYKEGGLSSQELKSWNGELDSSFEYYFLGHNPIEMSFSNGYWSDYYYASPTPLKPALKPNTTYGLGVVWFYQNQEDGPRQFFYSAYPVITFKTLAE